MPDVCSPAWNVGPRIINQRVRPVDGWLGIVAILVAGLSVGFAAAAWLVTPVNDDQPAHQAVPAPAAADRRTHEVQVRVPAGPPTVKTGLTGPDGRPVTVACAVCHTTRPPNPVTHTAAGLDEFHQGLRVQHGDLACTACHHPDHGYDRLRLADGRAVAYADVMQLCAQCHGPQYRDYQHGAHGGMTGHWDLTRGPRQRNTCTDCHDPHAPKYPRVAPAPGPNDRFLRPHAAKGAGHE